jgi:hypothetical protein
VFLSDGSSKAQQHQKLFVKQSASKRFNKKFDQKSETDFFSISFNHVFLGFLGEGISKASLKKY